jgi:hypothetical protein
VYKKSLGRMANIHSEQIDERKFTVLYGTARTFAWLAELEFCRGFSAGSHLTIEAYSWLIHLNEILALSVFEL